MQKFDVMKSLHVAIVILISHGAFPRESQAQLTTTLLHRYMFVNTSAASILADSMTLSEAYALTVQGAVIFAKNVAYFSSSYPGDLILPVTVFAHSPDAFSVELWVNTNLGLSYGLSIGNPKLFTLGETSPSAGFKFSSSISLGRGSDRMTSNDRIVLAYVNAFDGKTYSIMAPDISFSSGPMQLVVTLMKGGSAILYVNGDKEALLRGQALNHIPNATYATLGGSCQTACTAFSGYIEDVRIWAGAMSTEQV